MRRILWALVVTATAATAASVAIAQQGSDQSVDEKPRRRPPSRLQFVLEKPLQRTSSRSLARQTEPEAQTPVDQNAGAGILRYQRSKSSREAAAPSMEQSVTGLKNYHRELFGTAAPQLPGQATAARQSVQPRPFPAARQEVSDIQTVAAEVPATAAEATSQPAAGGVQQAAFAKPATQAEVVQQVSGTAPAAPELGTATPFQSPEAQQGFRPTAPLRTQPLPATTPEVSQQSILTNLSSGQPQVTIEWHKVGDISVGQESNVELIVTNNGEATAADVAVEAWFPASVRLTKASPQPVSAQRSVTWKFAKLDSGEEQRIAISLIPSRRGELAANANVRFTAAATRLFTVEEPMIKLAMQGPQQVMIGELAPHVVTITNPGTGVAHNVVIEVKVPRGLEHARGERLKMEVGSLNPSESRSVRLSLTAVAGGEHAVQVEARAGAELREVAASKINVLAPSLQLAVAGPSFRYVGRDAQYRVAVRNNGQATTSNVRSTYQVPEGFDFLSAGRGGKFDPATRTVSWFVGSVQPDETVEMSLRLKPVAAGEFVHLAKVVSEHGAAVESRTETKIEGTASIVLEVADLDDPVEIGRETAYEIRVSNEGSKAASNVGLSIELPNGMTLVDAKGPSQHIAESGLVVFRSLPALPPGKTAVFMVHITGSQEGNQRIRARLVSDSIQEPLTEEEITRFYAE
ncbi:MAG: hypothetical protein ACYTGL_23675 [Planctomycetota bacterium]|jgi:uncharacterized repeat protein (TIGR01451 family)